MRPLCYAAGIVLPLLVPGWIAAGDPTAPAACCPVRGMDDLVRMSRCDLEALYRQAEMRPLPVGFARGRAIYNPGSRVTVPASRLTHVLWQGKVIQDDGMMVNRVFGLKAVHARVYTGVSWLDGRPSLVMDYCGTSKLFPNVRDEVREVCPGLYLGLTHLRRDTGPELAMFFTLSTNPR
jgi:hypothetical protein